MDFDDVDVCNMDDDELFKLMDAVNYEDNKTDINDNSNSFCKKCNSGDNVIEDKNQGIIVCCDCGSVISLIVDQSIEQKAYNDDGNHVVERCSGITSTFLPQTSLGTTISGSPTNRLKKLHHHLIFIPGTSGSTSTSSSDFTISLVAFLYFRK